MYGGERVDIRRDTSGNPVEFEHSNGGSIWLTYVEGQLTEVIDSNQTEVRLTYEDSKLTEITYPDKTTRIVYLHDQLQKIVMIRIFSLPILMS